MKYSLAASILVAGATAQSFDVASAINALTTQTQQLTTDVMAYTGGDGATIKSDAAKLNQMIMSDDTSVKGLSSIDQTTALGLAAPVQSLGNAAMDAVNALVAKKASFVSNGQGSAVYSALVSQASLSNQFSSDLTSKVPSALQGIAANLAAPISSALASGVSAFADATGSGSSSSASATMESSSVASSSMASSATASSSEPAAGSMTTAMGGASSTVSGTASTGSPIATGSASTLNMGAGAAALAMIAVLAL
ncbi:MAG: hypothetical protein GOMPHAMPRED_004558 [Gomphillus americanus]|uniref:Cell wall protein n=1 Tax=Gomphillus americanus TaxID=1940652 RepID=A0A8H3FMU4_9LECA|nr:MAG: hypothetical protein GOMPHAMPRED_004558 [Gomphillus americanus]